MDLPHVRSINETALRRKKLERLRDPHEERRHAHDIGLRGGRDGGAKPLRRLPWLGYRDVSREAGVSTATVSRVLTGSAEVNPKTKKLVLAAIAKLKYRPNLVARGLRRRLSHIIALIVTDIENPFYTAICRGVEDAARIAGYSVILCNADRDIDKERQYIRVVADQNAAGVIISPASARKTDISELAARRLPVIAVDMALATVPDPSSSITRSKRLSDSSSHRKRLRAHRMHHGASGEARTAYDRGADIEGHRGRRTSTPPRSPGLLELHGDGGHQASRESSPSSRARTASSSPIIAWLSACCARFKNRPIAIPHQMKVIGFDELPWAFELHPHMSLVRQPAYRIGQEAARVLIDCADDKKSARHIVLEAELLERD